MQCAKRHIQKHTSIIWINGVIHYSTLVAKDTGMLTSESCVRNRFPKSDVHYVSYFQYLYNRNCYDPLAEHISRSQPDQSAWIPQNLSQQVVFNAVFKTTAWTCSSHEERNWDLPSLLLHISQEPSKTKVRTYSSWVETS